MFQEHQEIKDKRDESNPEDEEEEEEEDEEDELGVTAEMDGDVDYVPDVRDGIRRVEEALMTGNTENIQIKLEVLDEEDENSSSPVEKPLVARRKPQNKRKDSTSEVPDIIPQMVL